jgi:glycosyltransferase involved in cell wall biosynthesis
MIKDSIQVVALAYNEEDTIGEVLKRTHEVLSRNCERFEVVAFDDGSTDRTSDICDEFASTHPHTKVIRNKENKGIGYLLRETYLRASCEWTVIVCSDMQFDPYDLEKFFQYLKDYDIIISAREKRQDRAIRKYISSIDKLLLKLLFSASFQDLHWIKFVRKNFLDKGSITASSPFVETEILIRAKKKGARIKEFTVPHYPRMHGVAKGARLSNIIKSVRDLIVLFFKI